MKPQTLPLRQKVYELLQTIKKPMRPCEISDHLGISPPELANNLRYMLDDRDTYPELWRKRYKTGYRYAACSFLADPSMVQHPIHADLWRGWAGADRLGDGHADVFFERLNREP
jgi:hypothetical protein